MSLIRFSESEPTKIKLLQVGSNLLQAGQSSWTELLLLKSENHDDDDDDDDDNVEDDDDDDDDDDDRSVF